VATEIVGKKKVRVSLVRILIGTSETGSSKIEAPTKTISVTGISVIDAHKKILEMLQNIQ